VRRYLLDTTPLSSYLQGRPEAIALVDPWLDPHEAATSILVYGEVAEYLMARPNFATRDTELRRLLREITPFFLAYSTLRRYATIRRQLRQPYGPGLIGDVDILIAATALERGLTVVTTDADYTRVPGLSVLLLDRRTLTPVGGSQT
jgi:predicted nucleic acid-binding protein